jgi:antirestriction protein ArdC
MAKNENIQSMVTEKILEALDKGTIPWRKPWSDLQGISNLHSKKPYRGLNPFMLALNGYESRWWMTYNQARELGCFVKRGERSSIVTFNKPIKVKAREGDEKADENGEVTIWLLRYYRVFNAEQIVAPIDMPLSEFEKLVEKYGDYDNDGVQIDFTPDDAADEIVEGYPDPPDIVVASDGRAAYYIDWDRVTMPPAETFESSGSYYAALFHELTHSTGATKRLNRPDLGTMGDPYAREELTAELGAAMLCAHAEILDERKIENAAAYIDHWKSKLKDDPGLILAAASRAQRGVDLILNHKYESDNGTKDSNS